MTKYKRSRIYLLLSIREINRLSPEQSKQLEQLEKDLLATKPESDKQPLIDDWGREVKKGKSNKDIFEAMEQGSKEKLFKPKESVYVSDIPKGTIDGNFKISGDGTGESDKESKCPVCGGKHKTHTMLYEPQEELEVEELGNGEWEYRFNGTGEWMTLGNNLTEITDKLNSLIKAHNALVKEVRRQ